ncbi:MAG: nucleoside-diphosphate sugar epimerase/dehydratase [Myxococcota bacterium]
MASDAPSPTAATEPHRSSGVFLTYRRAFIIAVHLVLWTLSFLGAFLLRFDFTLPREYNHLVLSWVVVLLGVRSLASFYFGAFHGLWRYSGVRDLIGLFKATTLATGIFVLFVFFTGVRSFPRSVFVIDWLATIILVGGFRFSVRTLRELFNDVRVAGERRKILIVGAGNAGEMLLREIQVNHLARYEPAGFVDDNPAKLGGRIHGVSVLGTLSEVPAIVAREGIVEVIIAIPTATGREMRRIVDACKPAGAPIRTIPSMDSLIDGRVTLSQVRAVAIEDLLGRDPIVLDTPLISELIREQRVMVTGAGGSIGSELCRQVARFQPTTLLLVERAEGALFHVHRELLHDFPEVDIVPRVADIADRARMQALFLEYRPTLVLHAAAHKHVPMMEANVGEAIKNNILGTRTLAELANQHGTGAFVMISTDKAVNPTSVMGATKRAAEMFVQALSEHSATRFIAVRFGNVLASDGSVIPIFQQQIARGGPVTVTHPEMKRYFMTISEASQLVLQAGAMGRGGEIFILDMGEPVRIVDLARDVISLSGLRPDEDIEIQFIGARPGEKLFEELSIAGENADKTRHPKVFVGRLRPTRLEELVPRLDVLVAATATDGDRRLRQRIAELVPEYCPQATSIAGTLAGSVVH